MKKKIKYINSNILIEAESGQSGWRLAARYVMVLQWFIASGPIIDISLQHQMDALSSAESQFFYPSQNDLKKKMKRMRTIE